MTDPFTGLEQSLRAGPPDESGYRDRRRELEAGFSASAGGITPVQRVGLIRRVPRSQPFTASLQMPIAALVVVVVAIGGVAFAMRNNEIVIGPLASGTAVPSQGSTVSPTPVASAEPSATPTASPVPSEPAISIPPLSQTFTSTRHGFSMDYPAGWTATAATQSWPPNTFAQLGSPVLDQLALAGTYRLVIASQRLDPGQTEADWVAAYFPAFEGAVNCPNASDLAASPRLPIDGRSGYLRQAGCPMYADSAMSSDDIVFEAFVFADDRVYEITLDGKVDLPFFEALVATMKLDPASAIDPPPAS
jgi:hypothetical protein